MSFAVVSPYIYHMQIWMTFVYCLFRATLMDGASSMEVFIIMHLARH